MKQAQHTPGVFEIMSEFKSYELQHWLDTTPPSSARALFETGKHLEDQRNTLINALINIVDSPFRTMKFELKEIAKSALKSIGEYREDGECSLCGKVHPGFGCLPE